MPMRPVLNLASPQGTLVIPAPFGGALCPLVPSFNIQFLNIERLVFGFHE
jgi:hypothetical protein